MVGVGVGCGVLVWRGVASCGVVWCVVWCGGVWCGVVWCGVVRRGVVWCVCVCERSCVSDCMSLCAHAHAGSD